MLGHMAQFRFFLLVPLLIATDPARSAEPRALVRIPAETRLVADAHTGMKVSVTTHEFLMAPTEVTQREFEAVMGYNPARYRGPDRPVETVSWWESIRYANLLSLKENLTPCYDLATGRCDRTKNGYRLPTDAEWTAALGFKQLPSGESARQAAHLGFNQNKDASVFAEAIAAGTKNVASYPPSPRGLYDMLGNVWEWCDDFQDPAGGVAQILDPAGPARGFEKIIRGGSFLTAVTRWAQGYRSSMDPSMRSPYTGFRVCRTGSRGRPPAPLPTLSPIPKAMENQTAGLRPLTNWKQEAAAVRRKWLEVLGSPKIAPPPPEAHVVSTFQEGAYTGRLMQLRTEPDAWERICILDPAADTPAPRPVVIVPFYDVDAPVGRNLGGRRWSPMGVRSYAYLAAQQGFIAVAIRWYGESYGESYHEAVANLTLRHPGCSGLGKWIWDAARLVDYIQTLPQADASRIGIIGHSLGGKMALYAAAFDARIGVVVSSEPGIGLSFSNYDDYWYLGEALKRLPPGTDQHELLGLIAPRPFLLIAGDSADGDKSWAYINAARPAYALLGVPGNIGLFNHRAGHTPTPEAIEKAMAWLSHFLRSSSGQ